MGDGVEQDFSGGPSFSSRPVPFNERFPFPTLLEVFLIPVAQAAFAFLLTIPMTFMPLLVEVVSGGSFRRDASFYPSNEIAVIPILVWGWWRSRLSFTEAIGLRRASLAAVFAAIPFLLGFHILCSEVDNLQDILLDLPNPFANQAEALSQASLIEFIMAVLIVPLAQEPLFRGLILGGLLRRRGVVLSLLLSALAFGLLHFSPTQFLVSFLIGLGVGWVFIRTRSIWPGLVCIAAHNGVFFLMTVVMRVEIPGYNAATPSAVFQPLWFDLLGVFLTGAGLVLLCAVTSKQKGPSTRAMRVSGPSKQDTDGVNTTDAMDDAASVDTEEHVNSPSERDAS